MIVQSKVFIRNSVIKTFEAYLSRNSPSLRPKTVMILRLDAIGDYILFRNMLHQIRKSEKFRDYKITLCGNIAWKDLAVSLDSDAVDDFLWIDTSRFMKKSHWIYSYKKLLEIHSCGFEVLIDPNEVRTKGVEYLKKHSGVCRIIDNDPIELKQHKRILDDTIRTGKCALKLEDYFQFYTNKKFVETLTGEKCDLQKPSIETDVSGGRTDYVAIFPGAGSENRRWSAKNFGELCKHLYNRFGIAIKICGDACDSEIAREIISTSGVKGIDDLTGKTSLPQLVNVIARSALLVSNETCAVHIAASLGVPAVCISNGNHFGRFNPYPEEMHCEITTVYPDEINNRLSDYQNLIVSYWVESEVNIDTISPKTIFNESERLLGPRLR